MSLITARNSYQSDSYSLEQRQQPCKQISNNKQEPNQTKSTLGLINKAPSLFSRRTRRSAISPLYQSVKVSPDGLYSESRVSESYVLLLGLLFPLSGLTNDIVVLDHSISHSSSAPSIQFCFVPYFPYPAADFLTNSASSQFGYTPEP